MNDDFMVAIEGLRNLSLNELFTRLHNAISNLSKGIGELSKKNREMSLVDVIELRNHIKKRLEAKEDTLENEKLLKIVELFKEDKNAIELVKIDLDEWLEFLEAMKAHIEKNIGGAEKDEIAELAKMKKEITNLQNVLRKG